MHRDLLLGVWKDVLAAADPGNGLRRRLHRQDDHLVVRNPETGNSLRFPLRGRHVGVLGIGKAALGMVGAIAGALGDELDAGLIVTVDGAAGVAPRRTAVHHAGHPIPDERSVDAGTAVRALAGALDPSDLLIVALSGGGSALLCAPDGDLTLADLIKVNERLIASGLSIDEINAVRKHLSRIKGGRLAELAHAEILLIAHSDIISGDLATLASGPVMPDATTYAEASAALLVADPSRRLRAAHRHLQDGIDGHLPETPKPGGACFERVHVVPAGSPETLRAIVRRLLEEARLVVEDLPNVTSTPVAELASFYAAEARRRCQPGQRLALLAVGEPTVALNATPGFGGRSQHLALLLARELDGERTMTFLAAGTDGIDGNTDAAGAVVDGDTWKRMRDRGIDPKKRLAAFDSYTAHQVADSLLRTGPTGVNLTDVHILICEPT